MGSPSPNSANNFIFWAGPDADGNEEQQDPDDIPESVNFFPVDGASNGEGMSEKPESMYIKLFESEWQYKP
jgi:hypothetical protein